MQTPEETNCARRTQQAQEGADQVLVVEAEHVVGQRQTHRQHADAWRERNAQKAHSEHRRGQFVADQALVVEAEHVIGQRQTHRQHADT
jgi:hypothetical protein